MHGGADRDVSPAHSISLASRLHQLGKIYERHVFANDGHVLSDHRLERDELAAGWFRRFVSVTK